MIDQEKVGRFIAEQRKKKGLTQKQLAELLIVSDKAVSKWETGKAFPDRNSMTDLCKALDITVNELLAGEYIEKDTFKEKAEENAIDLVEYANAQRKDQKYTILSMIIGLICLIFFFILTNLYFDSPLLAFLDIPSLILIFTGFTAIMLLSGKMGDFFGAFVIVFHPSKEFNPVIIKKADRAMRLSGHVLIITGILSTLISVMLLLGKAGKETLVLPDIEV